jgi:hypothetical protein
LLAHESEGVRERKRKQGEWKSGGRGGSLKVGIGKVVLLIVLGEEEGPCTLPGSSFAKLNQK